jgi:oligo-1,6-glucosidase
MQADPNSILSFFKSAVGLRRRSPAILTGTHEPIRWQYGNMFSYVRRGSGQEMMIVLNMSGESQMFGIAGKSEVRVALSSIASRNPVINANVIPLAPFEGIVLEIK